MTSTRQPAAGTRSPDPATPPPLRSGSPTALLEPLVQRLDEASGGRRRFGIRLWDGGELPPPAAGEPLGVLLVRGPEALAHVLHERSEVGFGRAWVTGALEFEGDLERALTNALTLPLRLGLRDRIAVLRAARRLGALGLRAPAAPAAEARPSGRLHSLRRDREAVRHHYDVSNAFYRLVLGPTMVYSCAYFGSSDESLEAAQEAKLDLVCRKLRLAPDERLLDIGCGWGSLVLHAVQRYGVRAVGITLSEPQAELARERVAAAGLAHRCEIRVQDYRELDDDPYDKVASVGMVEHVGKARLDEYARVLRRLLRPGGLVLNHGITRAQERPWGGRSFVARFVFPDGELESLGTVVSTLERAGLEVRDVESLREHYALTLRRWAANLSAAREQAVAEAGAERERVWRLYMTGSALAFDRGEISVHQVLAAAPGAPHGLPLRR